MAPPCLVFNLRHPQLLELEVFLSHDGILVMGVIIINSLSQLLSGSSRYASPHAKGRCVTSQSSVAMERRV